MSAFYTVTVVSYRSLLMLLCDLASSHVLTSRNSRPFAECPHRLPNYSIAAKRPSRQDQGSAGSARRRQVLRVRYRRRQRHVEAPLVGRSEWQSLGQHMTIWSDRKWSLTAVNRWRDPQQDHSNQYQQADRKSTRLNCRH